MKYFWNMCGILHERFRCRFCVLWNIYLKSSIGIFLEGLGNVLFILVCERFLEGNWNMSWNIRLKYSLILSRNIPWNIPWIFHKYFVEISRWMIFEICLKYSLNIPGIFHGIFLNIPLKSFSLCGKVFDSLYEVYDQYKF